MPENKELQSVREIIVYKPPVSCADCTRVLDTFARNGISVNEVVVNAEHPVVEALKSSGEKISMPIVYVNKVFAFNGANIYKTMVIVKQELGLLFEAPVHT